MIDHTFVIFFIFLETELWASKSILLEVWLALLLQLFWFELLGHSQILTHLEYIGTPPCGFWKKFNISFQVKYTSMVPY